MNILGIDPGESPGYCALLPAGAYVGTRLVLSFNFDLAVCEGQFAAPGKASRNGKRIKVHHQTPLTLSFTAGMQLQAVSAAKKLVMTPPVWRGLLWSDGAGLYGLSQEATLERLRAIGAQGTDDEVMAYGLALAGRYVGLASSGKLRNGQPWKLKKQPGRFEVVIEKQRAKARAFVKALKGSK
jgi:hypothetical protein